MTIKETDENNSSSRGTMNYCCDGCSVITPKYLFEDSLYKIFSSLSFAKVSRLVDIRCIL